MENKKEEKHPLETLQTIFNYPNFRAGQLEAIYSILNGKDTFILFATGVGKSLCFQLPALHKKQPVVIVSPLLSLITDQIKNINVKFERELAVSFAATDISIDAMQKIASGESLLIYVTPEVFANHLFMEKLLQIHNHNNILFLAVDEAHFLSSQGFDFRPAFREIVNFRKTFPSLPIMALTATASSHIQRDVISVLQMKSPSIFTTSYDKPNLEFEVCMMKRDFAIDEITRRVAKTEIDGCAVVFTYTKRDATKVYEQIRRAAKTEVARTAALYHGDISYEQRSNISAQFNTGKIKLIIATGSSFGTGVDKPDIRHIYILSMPKNFEEFYQLAGRAGRVS